MRTVSPRHEYCGKRIESSLASLVFWFVSAHSTIEPFKYNYCRNFKVVIFRGKFIEEFNYGNPDTPAMKVKENRAVQK